MHDLPALARVLRALRRRHARRTGTAELTYREVAAAAGWSHGIVGEYLTGRVLPPTERFDTLIQLFGATPAEQGALATARDRVEENRRRPATPVPRQLPIGVSGFTGRDEQFALLDGLLGGDGSTAVISAVAGTAGVGKTALMVCWAHRVADRFPDGQLYVDLRGYDSGPPVVPADALAGFLRALGTDPAAIPADPAERAARYRTALAGRRMLILLDNASDADQVRPLLPGTPGCFVVVTSRDDLAGLVARDGARRIDLDVLTVGEAAALLRTLIGSRAWADPAAADELAACCARLPLALRIAAELAAADPQLPLGELCARLRDERRRLDLLDAAGDPRTAVRSVFAWSYRQLSPAAARTFRLAGLHPGQGIDGYAVAALTGTGLPEARAAVGELVRAHLIEPATPAGYAPHDLLRAYAAERAGIECGEAERRDALTRLLDQQLATAATAVAVLYPHEHPAPADAPPWPAPPLDDPGTAMRWLDEHRADLVALAVHAARYGWPRHCVELSAVLWRYFEVGGHYQEALAVHGSAVGAAADTGHGGAGALANLGGVHWWLGDHRTAESCFERSLAGHRERGDEQGQARALARLGLVRERLGRYRESIGHMRDAMEIYRRGGNRHGEGAQLINLGTVHRRIGRYDEAAEHYRRAAALFAEIGEARLEGYALGNLGAVDSLVGRHADALAHLSRALASCRDTGDRGGEGSALGTLGAVYARLGRHPEALDHLRRALDVSRETGDRSLETETLNTLGETLRAMRLPEAALDHHRAAREITGRTGDLFEHARAIEGIAEARAETGDRAGAGTRWRRALAIYLRLGVPEADRVRARLARLTR